MRANQPRCPKCKMVGRPNVVLFMETLSIQNIINAQSLISELNMFGNLKNNNKNENNNNNNKNNIEETDAIIVIGTSLQVQPVASLPFDGCRRNVPIIEINKEKNVPDFVTFETKSDDTEVMYSEQLAVDSIFLKGNSSDILPMLIEEIQKKS